MTCHSIPKARHQPEARELPVTCGLFYAKGSAAMGVRVILEEVGVPYELIQ